MNETTADDLKRKIHAYERCKREKREIELTIEQLKTDLSDQHFELPAYFFRTNAQRLVLLRLLMESLSIMENEIEEL